VASEYSEWDDGETGHRRRGLLVVVLLAIVALVMLVLTFYWSSEPGLSDVVASARGSAASRNQQVVNGYVTAHTVIQIAGTLLDKPGGYLSNDVCPPSLFMDDMPNWEFGALIQVRDFSRAMRNDMSRAQTQSQENPFLAKAEPQFNVDNSSWVFPSSEGEYRKGIQYLQDYLDRLADANDPQTQFFSRADNLNDWLRVVAFRLGSLSQRLSASVGQERINTNLAGDAEAEQATAEAREVRVKTPWLEIDDVFYEARGTSWALIHLFRAIEYDFQQVLEKKNAVRSLQQIIRELEATQRNIWSPYVLNGSDFGFFANYSLVMSSYISRANAAIIDLRDLLSQG
jgi:hypothetical protein